jgi:hypothetical protein
MGHQSGGEPGSAHEARTWFLFSLFFSRNRVMCEKLLRRDVSVSSFVSTGGSAIGFTTNANGRHGGSLDVCGRLCSNHLCLLWTEVPYWLEIRAVRIWTNVYNLALMSWQQGSLAMVTRFFFVLQTSEMILCKIPSGRYVFVQGSTYTVYSCAAIIGPLM